MNKILFYDGNCPFCKNLASKLEQYCIDPEIQFLSFRKFSEIELTAFHSDLTIDKLESEIQLIYNGKRYPGFFAIRKLAIHLKFWRYFFPILYFPLVPFIGSFVLYILGKIRK